MAECRSCKAPIIFAKTASEKFIPLDAVPVLGGNVWLKDGYAVIDAPSPTTKAHVSHFATCPEAKKFRRDR